MTTTPHPQYQPDREAMAKMRLMIEGLKGTVAGPEAREPFDHMMENVPAASGVAYEAAEAGGVPGWWCRPDNAVADACLLYLHGGGYVVGSARAYRHFVGQFAARANAAAFVADYGLAPERPFPAALHDAHAAYDGLAGQGFAKIALAGDSAGGGLTLALLSRLNAEARDGSIVRPSGAAVISAWTDLALTGNSMVTRAKADPLSTKNSLDALAQLYLADMIRETRRPRRSTALSPACRRSEWMWAKTTSFSTTAFAMASGLSAPAERLRSTPGRA